ncbi:MAG: hypothetical protein HY852_17375 [Bradyrhizobium sp.]|uniref:hypothetical protein n=1 Tax=Bradyrhizobium sp. TaxID=376 RepID=UPI0025BC64DC|nr:hypothetical protein [Bradyrhizobium sp.]MBI5263582.1 hypothetical protein [Bradyrhizobium sp.]
MPTVEIERLVIARKPPMVPVEPSLYYGVRVGTPWKKLMAPEGPAGAPRAYWREIAIVLAAKSAALVLIYLLFFTGAPPASPPGDHLFLSPGSHKGASG